MEELGSGKQLPQKKKAEAANRTPPLLRDRITLALESGRPLWFNLGSLSKLRTTVIFDEENNLLELWGALEVCCRICTG